MKNTNSPDLHNTSSFQAHKHIILFTTMNSGFCETKHMSDTLTRRARSGPKIGKIKINSSALTVQVQVDGIPVTSVTSSSEIL